jgi:hypothetical protein
VSWLGILALGLAAGSTRAGAQEEDAAPLSAEQVLERAFATRYEVDLTSIIDLTMRNEAGEERRRRFEAMSKVIDDRVHSIGRLVEPDYLRGMTVLTIEASDRSHDAFIFLPSLDRVRRVSTAQRGDAFFGTDVTYEDLERRRASDYALASLATTRFAGEDAWVVAGAPVRPLAYDRVRFVIARDDFAILQVEHFKQDGDEPFRTITAQRASMVSRDGHVVPTRMSVDNRARGTHTEVVLTDLRIDPPIDDHAFSLTALESQRRLPVDAHE